MAVRRNPETGQVEITVGDGDVFVITLADPGKIGFVDRTRAGERLKAAVPATNVTVRAHDSGISPAHAEQMVESADVVLVFKTEDNVRQMMENLIHINNHMQLQKLLNSVEGLAGERKHLEEGRS